MKTTLFITTCIALDLFSIVTCFAQKPEETEVWEPEPTVVTPGDLSHEPPSDAIILFNGKDLSHWVDSAGNNPQWKINGDVATVVKGTGEIRTKAGFGSVQLHIEWRTPSEVIGEGQGRGNSGIFLQGLSEGLALDHLIGLSEWLMHNLPRPRHC